MMMSRNIADWLWCIGSPELIISEHNFFSDSEHKERFLHVLQQEIFARGPEIEMLIEGHLKSLKTKRLGERFEMFIRFAFEIHPGYRVVAHNFQIRANGRTIGELDLLVEELATQSLFSIELACKYYLALPNALHTRDYIGPGLADRLDKKLHRLFTHQMTLCAQEDCIRELNHSVLQQSHSPIQTKCLLRGRMFRMIEHKQERFVSPINPNIESGFWGARAVMCEYMSSENVSRLTKDQWFTLVSQIEDESPRPQDADDSESLKNSRIDYAIAIATQNLNLATSVEAPGKRQHFVVPDDWLSKALIVREQAN